MKNFARGLIIGGLIGASISVLTNSDIMDPRTKKKMIKSGRRIMSGSNNMISDIASMFR